jgi:hypothetical protein
MSDSRWKIEKDDEGWYWVCSDDESLTESAHFGSLPACLEDAELHGYADGEPGCHPAYQDL